jgi:hypothetical protein
LEKDIQKPDFFIVGAPKCGTTSMYEYLKQHPEIFMPEKIKEPHFFCTDFETPFYIRDLNKYLSLFSGAINEKRIGEASVWYLYSTRAAQEINKFCPLARIIIMLRNPVDTLYSLHSQFLFTGNENITDFEDAINAETDRKHGKRIPSSHYPVEFLFYREFVRYSKQVKRYLDTFPKENILILFFEEFQNDTDRIYRETLRFLGVNEYFKPNFKVYNPNKRARIKILRRYIEYPPWMIRMLSKTLLSESMRKNLFDKLQDFNIIYEPRKPMTRELRRRLQTEFIDEVAQLSSLIGRDLYFWTST